MEELIPRRLIAAAGAGARLDVARDWLERFGNRRELLILAPTWSAANELARSCWGAASGALGLHRATLLQLASEVAAPDLAEAGLVPVGSLGREALAARAISLCAGRLDYFAQVAATPGLRPLLARTLNELRLHEVSGAELAGTGPPGHDLARLLSAFEEELERWALADAARVLRLAVRAVEEVRHHLVGVPLLLLDLEVRSPAERRFVGQLVAKAPAVLATVIAGDDEAIDALQELLGVEPETVETERSAATAGSLSRLERVRRFVFEAELPQTAGEPDESDLSVQLFSSAGEGRECAEIARRIRDLAAEGMGFDAMAILLRQPATHLPMVEEALERAGIPGYFTRGTVRPDPAGRALLSLLACAAENLSASRFAEYLSLGQVPVLTAAGEPPAGEISWVRSEEEQLPVKPPVVPEEPVAYEQAVLPFLAAVASAPAEDEPQTPKGAGAPAGTGRDRGPAEIDDGPVIAGTLRTPRHWERLLVDAAVVGGRDRWERRLRGLEAELRARAAELADEDEPRRARLLEQLDRLENLERFALPLIDLLAALPAEARWGGWLDRLEELAARALRHPARVLSVLAELRPMEQVGPVALDEVRLVLSQRLAELRTEPPEDRYGRVFVGTIAEARGRAFEAVFLPGLAEGCFPRKALEDPLLLDSVRARLESTLPRQPQRVARERLLLRVAAGSARTRLGVSYPNLDLLQGRSQVPSFYALDLLRAAEGRLPGVRDLERRAAAASASLLGWPAPERCERAIDDAEYDLAVLEPLLRRAAPDHPGRGRYLLEVNAHLRRSLRTRGRRWRNFFSEADGIVDPDEATAAILSRHRLGRRPYSPTALEGFGACPYRFLLHSIHSLRPREEAVPLEQMDPLTRGRLFHEVQFELFGELRAAGLLPLRSAELPRLLDLADRCLDRAGERYEEELAPAIPRVWRSEIEALRIDLRGWLRVAAEADDGWCPAHFELAFGLSEELIGKSVAHPDPVAVLDGIQLRGAIDLVEEDAEGGRLRVTDHKTGRAPDARAVTVGGGETLQPLLYALAAEQVLGKPVTAGRLFYCTRRGGYRPLEVPVGKWSLQSLDTVLAAIDRALERGFLPAAPREGACGFCDYRIVCGPYEELRIQRKLPERLEPLLAVRGLE